MIEKILNDLMEDAEISLGILNESDFNSYFANSEKSEIFSDISGIADTLNMAVGLIAESAASFISDDFLVNSTIDKLIPLEQHSRICSVRIRPDEKYYLELKKPLPYPANREGYDACGIELTVAVLKGYRIPGETQKPKIYLYFNVWGEEERDAFGALLAMHEPVFRAMLENSSLHFSPSCVFRSVEKLAESETYKRLRAYYSEEYDDENCFTFEKVYRQGESFSDFMRNFVVLMVMYESCRAFIINKDYDKLPDLYSRINKNQ